MILDMKHVLTPKDLSCSFTLTLSCFGSTQCCFWARKGLKLKYSRDSVITHGPHDILDFSDRSLTAVSKSRLKTTVDQSLSLRLRNSLSDELTLSRTLSVVNHFFNLSYHWSIALLDCRSRAIKATVSNMAIESISTSVTQLGVISGLLCWTGLYNWHRNCYWLRHDKNYPLTTSFKSFESISSPIQPLCSTFWMELISGFLYLPPGIYLITRSVT